MDSALKPPHSRRLSIQQQPQLRSSQKGPPPQLTSFCTYPENTNDTDEIASEHYATNRSSQIAVVCSEHGKSLQAVCLDRGRLLCIECVIQAKSGTDQHQLISMDQALDKIGNIIDTQCTFLQQGHLKGTLNDIEQRKQMLRDSRQAALAKLDRFSEYLIAKVEKRSLQVRDSIEKEVNREMLEIERVQDYVKTVDREVREQL